LQQPRWYTPRRCLALFCAMNILNYMDRGVIASNAVKDSVGGLFHLNNAQYFLLPSVFMVGLLIASPIFAQLTRTCNPLRLIGVGLSVWVLSTLGCGLAWNYGSLLVFRALVGVGEASFCSLAAPMIDDAAPAGSKSTWLALFFMCIPSGVAFGYVFGGLMYDLSGTWRAPFLLEALLMAPFAVFGFRSAPLSLRRSEPSAPTEALLEGGGGGIRAFARQWLSDVRVVLSHKVFTAACLGYVTYTASIGILVNAGPTAGKAMFPDDFNGAFSVDTVFGLITVVTGVVGTASGGIALDRLVPSMGGAMTLSAVSVAIASVLLCITFQVRALGGFIALFVAAELFLFAVSGVVNAGYMWSVPRELRPLACALTTVAIHVLGDVPSPPLAGAVVDHLKRTHSDADAWTITMMTSFSGIGVAALFWGIAAVYARTEIDYGQKDGEGEDLLDGDSLLLQTHVLEDTPYRPPRPDDT